MADVGRRRVAALALMLASGAAGLIYQIVWTQQSALWLGHEAAAVLAVVSAFFGGLALGAWWAGPRVDASARPWRFYALCEAVMALWGGVLMLGMGPLTDAMVQAMGPMAPAWVHWAWALAGTWLMLLPATAAMGATLPAVACALAPLTHRDGAAATATALYAANTTGAVLGVLVATFHGLPAWGLTRTTWLAIGLNLLCAGLALALSRGSFSSVEAPAPFSGDPSPRHPRARGLIVALAVTGLLGIAHEALVVRALSEVAEDTVYTFALLLAVYLLGTASGAGLHAVWLGALRHRHAARPAHESWSTPVIGLVIACLVSAPALWWAPEVHAAALRWLGPGMASAVAAEGLMALAAFLLPTMAMGVVFTRLWTLAQALGVGYGQALAANTLGASLGPVLLGVLVVPAVGLKGAFVALMLGYLALIATTWRPAAIGLTLVVCLVGWWAPPLRVVDVPPGGRLVHARDGVMAAVSVVEDEQGVARLRINNRQQEGSSATWLVDGRQALLPLLLQPRARHALFLGLGTGVTSSTAALSWGLEVDAVELLPEVIAASPLFWRALDRDRAPERLHVVAADARRYVKASHQTYDLIVADNFQPARSGSAALYTVEHFRAVQARLGPDGLFCQWLPLHQLDLPALRSIVRSFMAVFPHGTAILASNSLQTPVIGLLGGPAGQGAAHWSLPAMTQALEAARIEGAWPQPPQAFTLDDGWTVLGSFVAGPSALQAFSSDAPLNTDDHPIVAYLAPRITYAPDDSTPAQRLLTLLRQWQVQPQDVLTPDATPAQARRLQAYGQARLAYLEAGEGVQPAANAQDMLAQVEHPLLQVLGLSPDFLPALEPLVGMAVAVAAQDPGHALRLLDTLAGIRPDRDDIRQARAAVITSRP